MGRSGSPLVSAWSWTWNGWPSVAPSTEVIKTWVQWEKFPVDMSVMQALLKSHLRIWIPMLNGSRHVGPRCRGMQNQNRLGRASPLVLHSQQNFWEEMRFTYSAWELDETLLDHVCTFFAIWSVSWMMLYAWYFFQIQMVSKMFKLKGFLNSNPIQNNVSLCHCSRCCWGFTIQGEGNAFGKLLERAFGNLKLFCVANSLSIQSVRNFTVQNMHSAKGAFPYLGCKGSDTIIILKWLQFLAGLYLQDQHWSLEEKGVFTWMVRGAKAGLAFSQGIHGHGIWLQPSCVLFLRQACQRFGNAYSHLASHCVRKGYSLFGMMPKLHACMHFRSDFDDSIQQQRRKTLNPAVFDNSMSEDFIGKVARQSRRISFRKVEKQILISYQTKAHFELERFKKRCSG